MLTKAIEVIRYVRASAAKAGLNVTFENVNRPRHDGQTIFLPQITTKTTEEDLKRMMSSVDHEVAHDKYSSFKVLEESKLVEGDLLAFVWNIIEDNRINAIEAREFKGFRENWNETTPFLLENILTKAEKKPEDFIFSKFIPALFRWETLVSKELFPKSEETTGKYKFDKDILDVFNSFSDDLVSCQFIINKEIGTSATLQLAKDIFDKLQKNEEINKKIKTSEKTEKTKKEGKEGKGKITKKTKDEDEYNVRTVKVKEEDILCITPSLRTKHGKATVNLSIDKSKPSCWTLTDPDNFIVVDYTHNYCELPEYLKSKWPFPRGDYEERAKSKIVTQENFAQQVRKLIQIRSKVQRVFGVKKGKLDQSRLSRISINAPGISERIFKNKIENNTLNTAMSVLIDMSGSMGGDKLYFSMVSIVLLNEVCSTLGVPLEILGFTDGPHRDLKLGYVPTMFIYKAFCDLKLSTEKLENYMSISASFMAGNPDGECILWAYDRLLRRREKKRILIVMSDGSPAATKPEVDLASFTLNTIKEIEQQKLATIYGLGILSNTVKEYYTRNSVINEVENIPTGILNLLDKEILNIN